MAHTASPNYLHNTLVAKDNLASPPQTNWSRGLLPLSSPNANRFGAAIKKARSRLWCKRARLWRYVERSEKPNKRANKKLIIR